MSLCILVCVWRESDHLFKEVSVCLFGAHPSAIAAFSPALNEPLQEGKQTSAIQPN